MIFVDTSFWVALRLPRDAHHEQARRLAVEHQAETWVVSNQVRGETWTFLRRRAGFASAVDFLDRTQRSPRVRVEFVAPALETEALRWLRSHPEREYSFVDATSFVLARTLGITAALAFDGDFAAAGLIELRAP
ncbi:MAG: type II toxin-antitoxin system VapC family toxin [Egibacteraceae bacterium]